LGFPSVSAKKALVFGRIADRQASRSSGSSTKLTSIPDLRQRVVQQVVRPAVERGRRHDVPAVLGQVQEGDRLGRLPTGHGQGGHPALERGHPLLEHGLRRVHDPGVDVPQFGQTEEGGGVAVSRKV
jgi:hypothetical protein